jgi:hypothetical protein
LTTCHRTGRLRSREGGAYAPSGAGATACSPETTDCQPPLTAH